MLMVMLVLRLINLGFRRTIAGFVLEWTRGILRMLFMFLIAVHKVNYSYSLVVLKSSISRMRIQLTS